MEDEASFNTGSRQKRQKKKRLVRSDSKKNGEIKTWVVPKRQGRRQGKEIRVCGGFLPCGSLSVLAFDLCLMGGRLISLTFFSAQLQLVGQEATRLTSQSPTHSLTHSLNSDSLTSHCKVCFQREKEGRERKRGEREGEQGSLSGGVVARFQRVRGRIVQCTCNFTSFFVHAICLWFVYKTWLLKIQQPPLFTFNFELICIQVLIFLNKIWTRIYTELDVCRNDC